MMPQSFTQGVNYQTICLKFACCSSAVGLCTSSHLSPLDCANSISVRSILNFFWQQLVENCGVAARGRQIGWEQTEELESFLLLTWHQCRWWSAREMTQKLY